MTKVKIINRIGKKFTHAKLGGEILLLEIKNVNTAFKVEGQFYNALDDVCLEVNENEVLAIVGESGCGKSTLATSIIGLHDEKYVQTTGSIKYRGNELVGDRDILQTIRGKKIGMIFQDPLSSLNPLMRIEDQVKESLDLHTEMSEEQKNARVLELLQQVGLEKPELVARQYPHELSGGMRQRVGIAIAIACKPDLIIADEPTTALDVTIQAQILDLLLAIQAENHAGVILITHDLGVVAEMADRVAVMYAGQVVELGSAKQIFTDPKHPYTRSLLRSMPQAKDDQEELYVIEGMVPSLKNMEHRGCRFAKRVPWLDTWEHESEPQMHQVAVGHYVRCICWRDFKFPDETKLGGADNG